MSTYQTTLFPAIKIALFSTLGTAFKASIIAAKYPSVNSTYYATFSITDHATVYPALSVPVKSIITAFTSAFAPANFSTYNTADSSTVFSTKFVTNGHSYRPANINPFAATIECTI